MEIKLTPAQEKKVQQALAEAIIYALEDLDVMLDIAHTVIGSKRKIIEKAMVDSLEDEDTLKALVQSQLKDLISKR